MGFLSLRKVVFKYFEVYTVCISAINKNISVSGGHCTTPLASIMNLPKDTHIHNIEMKLDTFVSLIDCSSGVLFLQKSASGAI